MCVIVYKPKDIQFPSKDTLQACWNKNDDGAGYMFPYRNKVVIRKGFMTFDEFYNDLQESISKYGDKKPYVMHFRITTQGGVQAKLTHPYPLSKNMDDLRELNFKSDIGVAHNGIISLTSNSSEKDNNDTMKFITDYLSLIIKSRNFYEDEDTIDLIGKLCKSKLCILDGSGHTTMIGDFILSEDNCYYSNESFKTYKPSHYDYSKWHLYDSYEDFKYFGNKKSTNTESKNAIKNQYKCIWNKFKRDSKYYFIKDCYCPKKLCNDCSYCGSCIFFKDCEKAKKEAYKDTNKNLLVY